MISTLSKQGGRRYPQMGATGLAYSGRLLSVGETNQPIPVLVVDTHDGVKRRRKFREANERLRYMVQHAFDPQAYPLPVVEEIRELAEPAVETLESGRKQIDLQALEGRVREALLAKYEAFIAERQRMEEEDELVLYADA